MDGRARRSASSQLNRETNQAAREALRMRPGDGRHSPYAPPKPNLQSAVHCRNHFAARNS
jgi:hypothetical protein